MMENRGRVASFDLHESKISLISSGASRMSLDIISSGITDATEGRSELFGMADRVICDVPCSGLGVLAKKPDLRYKDLKSFEELSALQYSILTVSAKYLKVGGELLYSTCTINPAENEDNVRRFVEENPSFSFVDFEVGNLKSKNGMLTLYPHIHKTDGFFISKIKRNI